MTRLTLTIQPASRSSAAIEHRVLEVNLAVNLVLTLEVVRIGSGPVAIQSRSNLSVFHVKSP
jgi:hypothetical protein